MSSEGWYRSSRSRSKRLTRALLWIGCSTTILTIGMTFGVILLTALGAEVWRMNYIANAHYSAAVATLDRGAMLIGRAGKVICYMNNRSDSLDVSEAFIDELDALPAGELSLLQLHSDAGPWIIFKSDTALHRAEAPEVIADRRRQLRVGARAMWFDDAWHNHQYRGHPAFYVSADGSFAITRATRENGLYNAAFVDVARSVDILLERLSTTYQQTPPAADLPFWTAPYPHRLTREPELTAFSPIYGDLVTHIGFVGADFPLSMFSALDHDTDRALRGRLAVFSKDGKYVFGRSDASWREALQSPDVSESLDRWHMYFSWRLGVVLIDKVVQPGAWRIVYELPIGRFFQEHKVACTTFVLSFVFSALAVMLFGLWMIRRVITPLEQQAAALSESEAFGRTVFELSPVGLLVIELDRFVVVASNEPARAMVRDPAHGPQTLDDRLSLTDIARAFHGLLGDAVETSGVTSGNHPDGPAGAARHFTLRFATAHYQQQRVALCAVADMTQQRLAKMRLAAAKQEAEAANEAKSTFLATISHEIRTPLHGTLAALELLSATHLNDEQRALSDMMEGSARNLLQLIDDLLDFSKLGAAKLTLLERPFNLTTELEEVLRTFAARATESGICLRAFLSPVFDRDVIGDPIRISQIVANLLSNALKFTQCGQVVLTADIFAFAYKPRPDSARTTSEADGVDRATALDAASPLCSLRIRVTDTGRGIPHNQLMGLFTPFFQASESHDAHHTMRQGMHNGGTGLGLSIVRNLANLMQGDVEVSSVYGSGSTFTVYIPLQWGIETAAPPRRPKPLQGMRVRLGVCNAEERSFLESWLCSHNAKPIAMDDDDADVTLLDTAVQASSDNKASNLVVLDPLGGAQPQWRNNCYWVSAYSQRGLITALQLAAGEASMLEPIKKQVSEPVYPLRVLVVEDHPINLRLLARQVERFGCDALCAESGRQACDYLRDGQAIDLILTDINMPEMNGFQLADAVIAMGKDIPIYAVTADVVARGERPAVGNLQGYLPKPLSSNALEPVLRTVNAARLRRMSRPQPSTPVDRDAIDLFDPSHLPADLRAMMVESMDADIDLLEGMLTAGQDRSVDNILITLHRIRGATLAVGWVRMSHVISTAEDTIITDIDVVDAVIAIWRSSRHQWSGDDV